MKFSKSLLVAIALFATLAIGSTTSQAQEWGRHPAYLHALSDLRLMRAYLDRLTPNERIDDASQNAIREIDAAIRVIKEASFDDGKDLRDHLPIDARIEPFDRFHRAREAGNAAFADINREEDNDYARGLKHRALDHIVQANQIVDHIIEHLNHRGDGEGGFHHDGDGDNHHDGGPYGGNAQYVAPPAAMHYSFQRALGDLRQMRAYLDRPTPNERIDQETQSAIDSIEAVIRDIKQASIDDDRNYHGHIDIDPRIPLPARLHQAREAGNRAWAEINSEQDFAFAGGLKHRSMDQIEHANHIIDHIMEHMDRR